MSYRKEVLNISYSKPAWEPDYGWRRLLPNFRFRRDAHGNLIFCAKTRRFVVELVIGPGPAYHLFKAGSYCDPPRHPYLLEVWFGWANLFQVFHRATENQRAAWAHPAFWRWAQEHWGVS